MFSPANVFHYMVCSEQGIQSSGIASRSFPLGRVILTTQQTLDEFVSWRPDPAGADAVLKGNAFLHGEMLRGGQGFPGTDSLSVVTNTPARESNTPDRPISKAISPRTGLGPYE